MSARVQAGCTAWDWGCLAVSLTLVCSQLSCVHGWTTGELLALLVEGHSNGSWAGGRGNTRSEPETNTKKR
eukprot:3797903-Amphidinium_carterae.1